jgi:hypothetical protein
MRMRSRLRRVRWVTSGTFAVLEGFGPTPDIINSQQQQHLMSTGHVKTVALA